MRARFPVSFAPAFIRRAFFVTGWVALAACVQAAPPASAPPPLTQLGKLDQAEARQALEQLRRQGISGDYYLEFQLRVMPRRGSERLLTGKMWGARNEFGPLTRVAITGKPTETERRLLIQNGPRATVWRWEEGRSVEVLGVAALFEPVVPGIDLTAFDLEMPFLYWDQVHYEGLRRHRGRPAHVLVLRPPTEFSSKYPTLTAVRVHLDTQYNALVQTELLGESGEVTKTVALLDLKKIGEQWVPKSFDARDEATHDKTRLSVTAAALDLEFAPGLFEPALLANRIPPPKDTQLVRIEP